MINNFSFVNEHLALPIAIAALVLLLVFIWKEWSQAGSRRFFLKLLLAFFAVGSLTLIALKPAFPSEETAGKIVLLTEGFENDQLDSLQKAHEKLKVEEYEAGRPLSKEVNSSEVIFILGHGIRDFDLWQLDDLPAVYLRGSAPRGIVRLKYSQENEIGDSLMLQGLYMRPTPGNRLILHGAGGAGLDSLVIKNEDKFQFRLGAELKAAGNYVFSLVEKDSLGKVQRKDPVPVKVAEKQHMKVLIVNSFPTFETRYLKNFLAEAGNEVVVRSRITRGRFKYEYFNTERISVTGISWDFLESFDLLIMDAGSLQILSAGEKNAIANAVREGGLGIFIQPNEEFFTSTGNLAVLNFDRAQGREFTVNEWPGISLAAFSYTIRDDFAVQAIHTSNKAIGSAYKQLGQGRIGSSIFSGTYELLLDGHQSVYARLWSGIAENLGRKEEPEVEWEQKEIFAYRDEPAGFKIRTAVESPAMRDATGNPIPLLQEVHFPLNWQATLWPRETGWNSLQVDTLNTYDYYVMENSDWQSLLSFETREANSSYFRGPTSAGHGSRPLEPVNMLWFFGVFLLCMGGLWLEPKI